MISIVDLASELNVHKQSVHKLVKRLGINVELQIGEQSRGQKAAFVSDDDAELVRRHFSGVRVGVNVDESFDASGAGWFYLIQLEPEVDPGGYKVGFATDTEQRLRSHKTSAPFAVLLNAWPCKLLWEKTAIDCVAHNSEKIHTEVFRTNNIKGVVDRAKKFFELMPDPNK